MRDDDSNEPLHHIGNNAGQLLLRLHLLRVAGYCRQMVTLLLRLPLVLLLLPQKAQALARRRKVQAAIGAELPSLLVKCTRCFFFVIEPVTRTVFIFTLHLYSQKMNKLKDNK